MGERDIPSNKIDAEPVETNKPEEKPVAERGKAKKKSNRYELQVKEEQRKAEEKIQELRLGKATTRHLSALEAEDIAAAKLIVEKARSNKNLSWLMENNIPEDPIVLDVLARIASAPTELRNDPKWLLAVGSELQGAISGKTPEEEFAIVRIMGNIRGEIARLTGFEITDHKGMEEAVKVAKGSTDNKVIERAQKAELTSLALNYLSEIGLMAGIGMPPALPPDWLMFENPPSTLPQDATLYGIINQLKLMGENPDWRGLKEIYNTLDDLVHTGTLSPDDMRWAEGIGGRLLETYHEGTGNQIIITPEEIYKLTRGPDAERMRDKEFHKRVKKILFDPNEETSRQLNLYDQAYIDTFMEVISHSQAEHPVVTHKTMNIGKEVVGHYRNKLDTVLRLSDIELQARHASGDVESFSKTMNYFENKFAVEAIQDPLVEDMLQCIEQAIKINRDNNEDFMPAELARYDPRTQTTPIDELALQLFRERMAAGAVHDYKRDPVSGLPELDPATGKTTLLRENVPFNPQPKTPEEVEELDLRLFATLRIAKGMGVVNNRTIELYAFTRTPAVDIKSHDYTQPFEQSIAVFSSKPYGGLTRWVNPMSEWFRMFGFGDTLFVPFFNTIVGGKRSAAQRSLTWTMAQTEEAMNIADSGDRKQLEKKFGTGVSRLMDLIEQTSFHSRFGPSSTWGIEDSTQGWKAKGYERLGGSMRLVLAHSWADKGLKDAFKNDPRHAGLTGVALENARNMAFAGEGPEGKEWKERLDKKERIYKTWIWAQTVMRNPQGVASHIRVDYGDPTTDRPAGTADPKPFRGKLRSKIMYEIFDTNDLAPYTLQNNHGEPRRLIIERDVASGHRLTEAKKDLAARVAIVDADLSAVMRYAMNSGPEPREITDADFDLCIKGARQLFVVDPNDLAHYPNPSRVVVREKRRREQAKEYFHKVQREMLGKAVGDPGAGWDFDTWKNNLGTPTDATLKVSDPKDVVFSHEDTIDTVLGNAQAAGGNIRLVKDLIDEPIHVHIGTEDVQWSYLDLDSLGDRHWGRKGNDNLNHAKTEMLQMKHFHVMTGKAKMEDLVKSIQEIGMQGKDEDPKEAAKAALLWAEGTHNIYRQRKLAGVPIIGRILPALGIPMSIAQEKMGVHSATFWSMNNSVEFADQIGATRVIPDKRFMDGKDFGENTMEKLRKEIGASRLLAAFEMFIIGYVIVAGITAATAFTKSVEEDK